MQQSWKQKFVVAIRGIGGAMRKEGSFRVHLPAAGAVLLTAVVLRMHLWQWCILLLCIAIVLVSELFNTAVEALAKAITRQQDEHIAKALDVAAGAVLTAAIAAAAIGTLIVVQRITEVYGSPFP